MVVAKKKVRAAARNFLIVNFFLPSGCLLALQAPKRHSRPLHCGTLLNAGFEGVPGGKAASTDGGTPASDRSDLPLRTTIRPQTSEINRRSDPSLNQPKTGRVVFWPSKPKISTDRHVWTRATGHRRACFTLGKQLRRRLGTHAANGAAPQQRPSPDPAPPPGGKNRTARPETAAENQQPTRIA